jgi:hypothetical protein
MSYAPPRSFLNEKEKPLYSIIARGTRIYNTQSKGPALVHVRDMMKIISLPVFKNLDRRSIAIGTVQALQSGTVQTSSTASMHMDEHGVSMLLKASRLSKLLLRNPQLSTSEIEVTYLEGMYAPALRQKLLRRKQKLLKKRLADAFFIKKHGPVLFKHWRRLWWSKKRAITLFTAIERRVVLRFSEVCLLKWRKYLLQVAAAIRTQSAFRGYRVRMAFFRASQAKFIADRVGALYYWRSTGKHEADMKILEDLAAVQIQKVGRGVVTRKRFVAIHIATENPPRLCFLLKLRRDGNLSRHAEATTIQCAFRCFIATRAADALWLGRHNLEQRAHDEAETMKQEHAKDLAAVRVVERMVESKLLSRLAHDRSVAEAMQAANDVTTLKSKRRHTEKQRYLELESENVRKRQAAALLEFNAKWDETISKSKAAERERWESLIFFKRPEEGSTQEWDTAKSEYMIIAKQLTSKRRNLLEQNIVDAKNAFVESKLAAISNESNQQRSKARRKLTTDLAEKLGAFRKERSAASSSGETAAGKTICDFVLRCQQRAALRSVIREAWKKDYDLMSGSYFYVNTKTKSTQPKKPLLLGLTDVEIVNTWRVMQGTFEGRLVTYFFNPKTHTLSWTQPQFTVLCYRCSLAFVEFTCNDGCGDMCTSCWAAAHPSADSFLAVHSWTAKAGGRPVHVLDQYDTAAMYASAAEGTGNAAAALSVEQRFHYAAREETVAGSSQAAVSSETASASHVNDPAEAGYYDEEGGFVWNNGAYTSKNGEYYPPAEET